MFIEAKYRLLMLSNPEIVRKSLLTDHQMKVVKIVKHADEYADANEVAARAGITQAAASAVLVKLVDKGYLTRTNIGDPTGGNMYLYRLRPEILEGWHTIELEK